MIYIRVRTPVGRKLYVSTDYSSPSDRPTPTTLTLPAGPYTIETVFNFAVDYRGSVDNIPDETSVNLDLDPVEPPEPI